MWNETRGYSWEQNDQTRSDVSPVAGNALAQISPLMCTTQHYLFLILHRPVSPHLPIHYSSQLKQKLWHFKDYLYLSRAVDRPPSFFLLVLKLFLYLQISTTAYINIQLLAWMCRGEKNQRPFKKGNHNIMSIFSFHCLNWHEEYNQISLLTVTHMPLQEREK